MMEEEGDGGGGGAEGGEVGSPLAPNQDCILGPSWSGTAHCALQPPPHTLIMTVVLILTWSSSLLVLNRQPQVLGRM